MNRLMRRMQIFGKGRQAPTPPAGPADTSGQLDRPGTPQDVSGVRAKNQGHGKKTADKWNQ
jgi:hypothetical protein